MMRMNARHSVQPAATARSAVDPGSTTVYLPAMREPSGGDESVARRESDHEIVAVSPLITGQREVL